MATTQQIAELRRRIGEPTDADPWTDAVLNDLIDRYGENIAAAEAWEQKASAYIDLVNISEGGSSRSNSAIYERYMERAKRFRDDEAAETGAQRAPRTREAVRQ
jgi:hypothetical protein